MDKSWLRVTAILAYGRIRIASQATRLCLARNIVHNSNVEMRTCKSIFQRLKLSPNEHLETYVRQHDIVDIKIGYTKFDDNNDDYPYDSEN
jgi:hypothetical protein